MLVIIQSILNACHHTVDSMIVIIQSTLNACQYTVNSQWLEHLRDRINIQSTLNDYQYTAILNAYHHTVES